MIVTLNEDELREILQAHVLAKHVPDGDMFVVNEYTTATDEDGNEVEGAFVSYTVELEKRAAPKAVKGVDQERGGRVL